MAVGLYPELLGSAWNQLHESLQQVHRGLAPVRASGYLRICHGEGQVARHLVALFGMPPAGEAVPTLLTVMPCGQGEKWLRTFGGRPMVTTQWPGPPGILIERMGFAELRFQLSVLEGGLIYQPTAVVVSCAPLAIPLPAWLAPRVAAREMPVDGRNRTHISVHVAHPLVGMLISYEGIMTREEAT
jgi:Domain of unknown function (DUF4166)